MTTCPGYGVNCVGIGVGRKCKTRSLVKAAVAIIEY